MDNAHWGDEHPWLKNLLDSQLAVSTPTAYCDALPKIFLHLCSGPPRKGDFVDEIIRRARRQGEGVVAIRIDPIIDPTLDLTDGKVVSFIRDLILLDRVYGILCSPLVSSTTRSPSEMWSARAETFA